jgi:hypothetical protein
MQSHNQAHASNTLTVRMIDRWRSIDEATATEYAYACYSAMRLVCIVKQTTATTGGDVWRLQSNAFQEFNDCSVSVSVNLRRLFSSFDHGE